MNWNYEISKKHYKYCWKLTYNVVYTIFTLLNNDFSLTEEQKEILQKLHDWQMPIEYLNTIYKLIQQL